jgi:hypothetical protein
VKETQGNVLPSTVAPEAHRPLSTRAGCSSVEGRGIGVTTHDAQGLDTASTKGDEASTRSLASRYGSQYIPSKAAYCEQCAACKQVPQSGVGAKVCVKACRLCPNTVMLGAENKVVVQVDGVTAIEWAAPGGGQGRALQDSGSGGGVGMVVDAAAEFKQSLTVDGAASIGSGIKVTGGIENSGGGITDTGAITGATDITASGEVSAASVTATSGPSSFTGGIENNGGGITDAGEITGATDITATGGVAAASMTASGTVSAASITAGTIYGGG